MLFQFCWGRALSFLSLFNMVAGDPTQLLLGKHATAKQMMELRRELGLDRPFFVQYFDIVKSAFTFDFGRSWSTKQEIIEMIKVGAMPSLTVSIPAFVLSTIVSISISLIVSFFRGAKIDRCNGIYLCRNDVN